MAKTLTGKIPREKIGLLELQRLPDTLLAEYRALGDLSGLVSDACDELGIACGVPSAVLRPTDPGARIAGQALTALDQNRGQTTFSTTGRERNYFLADTAFFDIAIQRPALPLHYECRSPRY